MEREFEGDRGASPQRRRGEQPLRRGVRQVLYWFKSRAGPAELLWVAVRESTRLCRGAAMARPIWLYTTATPSTRPVRESNNHGDAAAPTAWNTPSSRRSHSETSRRRHRADTITTQVATRA